MDIGEAMVVGKLSTKADAFEVDYDNRGKTDWVRVNTNNNPIEIQIQNISKKVYMQDIMNAIDFKTVEISINKLMKEESNLKERIRNDEEDLKKMLEGDRNKGELIK